MVPSLVYNDLNELKLGGWLGVSTIYVSTLINVVEGA